MSALAETVADIDTLFGNDINITLRIINRFLEYENQQSGLTLTSEQDSAYVAVSNLAIPDNKFADITL